MPYRHLFARPGAKAFTAGNLIARLPMGMFSVSAVVMIAGARDSYALAGAVTATGLAATALVAPWTARLVDRYGQARIAVPATLLAALGSLALVLCVRHDTPDWTLFAAYAATATTPNIGGMSRARWAHLLDGDPAALHTANAFEQAADELCFMLGPVVAAFLCGTFFPEAGTLLGVALLLTGVLLFAAARSTEPPPTGASARGTSPIRAPGIPPLLAVCVAMGTVFGAMEVVTLAFADARGQQTAAGLVLGLQAAGSCAAGLVYGRVRPSGPAEVRYVRCVAAMAALLTLPLLAAALTGSLLVLAGALLLAGMATAPTMVTGMALVQQRTPDGRLNEGMTLAVTGLLGGIACGSALGGWTAEHVSVTAGYGVPVAAALTALALTLGIRRPYRSSPRFADPSGLPPDPLTAPRAPHTFARRSASMTRASRIDPGGLMVKITDVARHAGVSPSTVSYTLSGKRPISEETRRRVHASIRALGYRPHAGARSPDGDRSRVLALVLPLRAGVHVPVAMELAASVVTTAETYDHDVLLLTREDGEGGLRRVADAALVNALMVTDVRLHDPRLPLLRTLDLPTVLIGFPADATELTCVDLDFRAAGEACVDHLAALGHRVVALVGSPPEVYVRRTAYAQRVVQGFTAAADRHGLASAVHPCEATPAAARATAERLLREQPALTGVVVHNEAVLDPLLDAFAQLGLRVPDDLSVVALCPASFAESARVPLTSVALPTTEIGTHAVDLLIRKLNGEPVPATTLLPPELRVRASTAPRRTST